MSAYFYQKTGNKPDVCQQENEEINSGIFMQRNTVELDSANRAHRPNPGRYASLEHTHTLHSPSVCGYVCAAKAELNS